MVLETQRRQLTCPKPLMLLVAEFVFLLLPSLWLFIFCMLPLSSVQQKGLKLWPHDWASFQWSSAIRPDLAFYLCFCHVNLLCYFGQYLWTTTLCKDNTWLHCILLCMLLPHLNRQPSLNLQSISRLVFELWPQSYLWRSSVEGTI